VRNIICEYIPILNNYRKIVCHSRSMRISVCSRLLELASFVERCGTQNADGRMNTNEA